MLHVDIFPAGQVFYVDPNNVPEGWTVMDGKNGTIDMSNQPCFWHGGGPVVFMYPNCVWAMKDWPTFTKYYNNDYTPKEG